MEKLPKREHNLILKDRAQLKVEGVIKIEYFSPEAILVQTEYGRMAVKGAGLFVDSLNAETGELMVRGSVNSIAYYEKDGDSAWFKRLFK